jgi:hypothetical protein
MIKKIFLNIVLIFIFLLSIIALILSTTGVETNRFNELISNTIDKKKNIKLELKSIFFKLDPKELSLFLETKNPIINHENLSIPIQTAKVYIDFLSLVKTELKIKKIDLNLGELDIFEINKLSKFIKPSNFKNFLTNKINKGKLISEVEIFFDNKGAVENFIIKGDVKNFEANIYNSLYLSKTRFNFFADNEDILIKNIFGIIQNIKISDGDVKLNLKNGINLNTVFKTKLDLNETTLNQYKEIFEKYNLKSKIKLINGNFNNNVSVNLDSTYKLKDYKYNLSGILKEGKLEIPKMLTNSFIKDKIKEIYFENTKINSSLSPKNFELNGDGKYSFNNLDFLNFNFSNILNKQILKLNLNFDLKNIIDIALINYKKPKKNIANISINLEKKKNEIIINQLDYKEKTNFLKMSKLNFKNNDFQSLKKIEVKTPNNEFLINWDKKILIKGKKFDATNLPKLLGKQENNFKLTKINNDIEIDFKNIKAPLSEKIENFRLIGEIQRGKFVKISAKGDFGGGNFLDISLKKAEKSEKRFLEVYSDLPRPLLTEYKFFNGLSGGKLLFTSLIDGPNSSSKLKIDNFNIVNAPGVIKLLSLADLGGLADLAEGEGLSFDILEIDMEKNDNFLKLNEIIALGPSLSVLMEGYQDGSGVTSLRGTLVPAKTLNKIISKIPVIGNIVIPKEAGEGLFGISFKMKGPKGDIKTTINPIRTLTPRFIQKIVDRNKASN